MQTQMCNKKLLDALMRTMCFEMWAVSSKVWAEAVTTFNTMYLGISKNG